MKLTQKVEGLKELEKALGELSKASGKSVLRRVLKKNAEPIAELAAQLAPIDQGALRDSITVAGKLTKRQRAAHKRMFKNDRASVEIFVGAGGLAQATQQEFGNSGMAAQPYLRPAWDQLKGSMPDAIAKDLWVEVKKAAERAARKQARLAAKG